MIFEIDIKLAKPLDLAVHFFALYRSEYKVRLMKRPSQILFLVTSVYSLDRLV